MAPKKKAVGLCKNRTAIKITQHSSQHERYGFYSCWRTSGKHRGRFYANPYAGIGRQQYRAAGAVLQFFSVLENTMEYAGNLPDSEVFSRPEFGSAGFTHLHGYGRDGLVREAGRMAYSMFSTSRPPVALEKAASGLQSQYGAETMTTVNTPPTPKTGNTSQLIRQQAIESALNDALHLVRTTGTQHGIQAATGRAMRAAGMLKQACADFTTKGA
jgi:hypothetical protein